MSNKELIAACHRGGANMSEYTPSVDAVREAYAGVRHPEVGTVRAYEEFDRWLAEVERAAAAQALDWAVEAISSEERAFVTSEWGTVVRKLTIMDSLRARAAEIKGKEQK